MGNHLQTSYGLQIAPTTTTIMLQTPQTIDGNNSTEEAQFSSVPAPILDEGADSACLPNGRPKIFKTLINESLFVFACVMAVAMPSFLLGAQIVIADTIGRDLNMSPAAITWITASGALTSGAFLLLFGRLASFGQKTVMMSSTASFTVFVLIAAFAKSGIHLNIMGGLLGLCAAGAAPSAAGMLGSTYQLASKRKNIVFSIYGAGAPVGFVLGSISSGIATHIATWRAPYIMLSVIYLIVTAAIFVIIPGRKGNTAPVMWRNELKQFDILGALLVVTGMGLTSASLTLAPSAEQGWRTPYIISMLTIGISCLIAFVFWQHYFSHPLMPLRVWKDKNFSLIVLVSMLGFSSFSCAQFWLALYLQQVVRASPLMVSVQLLPQAIAGIILNLICGRIMHRVRNEFLMIIGATAYTVASVMLIFLRPTISYWALIFPALLLVVVGADFQFTISNMYVLASFPRTQQSLASGVLNTMVRLSVNLGLGISTATFSTVDNKKVEDAQWLPFSHAWYVTASFAGLSVILALFLRIGTQGGRSKTATKESETAVTPIADQDVAAVSKSVPTAIEEKV